MEEQRPNPDKLLRQLRETEKKSNRGKLKIFFGYAAGVGKTYAMLDAAHAALKAGADVVAGYVEPHTRPDTMALLDGLEILPPFCVNYKGVTLKEFDLDGALKRNPQLILVDELAHTNAQGCRHTKRYSDVEELLRAGIDVYTTINVQHLESLNDIVASITQVVVRERIPDSIFDKADQVELVDIEPDDLIERLNEGKIYREGQAQRALNNFFIRENLVALREIALRRTADRVNRLAEKEKAVANNNEYYTGEHILVCLSSSPSNGKVIRTAARMANAFHASFTALFVETPGTNELNDGNHVRLRENLKLAEQLGAKIATVYGEDVPHQIAAYAKESGISKIVMGRSNNKTGFIRTKSSFVERLTGLAPNLDVHIIPDNLPAYKPAKKKKVDVSKFNPLDIVKIIGIMLLCTLIGLWFEVLGFSEANIITVYILGVLVISTVSSGKLYGVATSLLAVLTFNFFFTDPRHSLQAYDSGYPVTFLVMLVASLITSSLTIRVKAQAKQTARKAHRTEVLLETSKKLQRAKNLEEIEKAASSQIMKLLDRPMLLYTKVGEKLGEPQLFYPDGEELFMPEYFSIDEQAVAAWVFKNKKPAGVFTDTLPGAKAFYLPVYSHEKIFGVVAIVLGRSGELEPFERSVLLAMLTEVAFAIEKYELNESQKEITMQAERERLRANLLRAISHDLRTPLTSISGNASVLLGNGEDLDISIKHQLYEDIYDDSLWLINLVENLLSVTRIDNGTMNIYTQPEMIQDVITEALQHINRKKVEHCIKVVLDDDMLMANMDSRLIVQVIINIVDNAIKYTQVGSHILITAKKQKDKVLVEVVDDGDGISDQNKERLFDMFFTANNSSGDSRRGLGLGLSLCKSIMDAHGGGIYVKDNQPKGTIFGFTLTQEEIKTDENDYFSGGR